MTEPAQRCHNCKYSRTYQVYDPVLQVVLQSLSTPFPTLSAMSTITKCHFQGAPQRVNAETDWCDKWSQKKDT